MNIPWQSLKKHKWTIGYDPGFGLFSLVVYDFDEKDKAYKIYDSQFKTAAALEETLNILIKNVFNIY